MGSIWTQTLDALRGTITNAQYFSTFIEAIQVLDENTARLVLGVGNSFKRDWINDHYLSLINEAAEGVLGRPIEIELVVSDVEANSLADGDDLPAAEPDPVPPPPARITNSPALNPKYTFDTFVVGDSNRFADAAAKAVASNLAGAYNPLVIFGGVGLGKTHLLSAIGLDIREREPSLQVHYVTSETFINDLINSIRFQKMPEFRERYRGCDLLLVDDIQFMAGKERTQEEFFHTFNTLHQSGKQIVLTSDKYPQEIPEIEERLRSRFTWGLTADIQPPEIETRVAILQEKAAAQDFVLPPHVAFLVARSIKSNVRELESCLIRLEAHTSLTNEPVTEEMAKRVLADILESHRTDVTIDHIMRLVSNYFNVKITDLRGKSRKRTFTVPRQVAMYLSRKHVPDASYPIIGEKFGGKDHSTVMAACRRVENLLLEDAAVRSTIQSLERQLT